MLSLWLRKRRRRRYYEHGGRVPEDYEHAAEEHASFSRSYGGNRISSLARTASQTDDGQPRKIDGEWPSKL